MKVLVDTNVVLDYLLDRKPFADEAEEIFAGFVRGEHKGIITTSSVTDIFYLAGRQMKEIHILYLLLEELFERIYLCNVANSDIMEAMAQRELDFEDCLISVCARRTECDFIVTRNVKDFYNSPVRAITPIDFLKETNTILKTS